MEFLQTDAIPSTNLNGYSLYKAASALIFYTTEGRPAAAQEAWILQSSLETCGINPTLYIDFSKESLMYILQATIDEDPSALLVFIMAYGDDCVIYDRNREPVYICDILSAMSETRMDNRVKILVFESFRSSSENFPPDATVFSPSPGNTMTIKRGWLLKKYDTFVYHSVLCDDAPLSRLFIIVLASQIESSQRIDGIQEITLRTSREMHEQWTPDAIEGPEFRSSMGRNFYLKDFSLSRAEAFDSNSAETGHYGTVHHGK